MCQPIISLDGRTSQKAKYNNEPELLRLSVIREGEWTQFIEACFDPRSPMNKKLKEMMLSMSGESILD